MHPRGDMETPPVRRGNDGFQMRRIDEFAPYAHAAAVAALMAQYSVTPTWILPELKW